MLLLIAFSFLGGIVTILSPCILPVLPIILSGSLTGDSKRPWGIVFGFVASFTFFTLFLTSIVNALGVSPNLIRSLSILIIAIFGLSLLVPRVQTLTELLFSKLSRFMPTKTRSGFFGGFTLGLSLGLIWTPCVGPILASVISLALTGSVTGTAALITLAYSLGTAIPMLIIIKGGREVMARNPWLTNNTKNIQKIFGVIMVLMAFALYFQIDRQFQSYILEKFPNYGAELTKLEDNQAVKRELETIGQKPNSSLLGKPMPQAGEQKGPVAPELIPGGEWLNSKPLTLNQLKGKVVLIDFWTYTCINCIRTLPYLKSWNEKYKDDGVVIIGVHTPEFEFEKDPNNLQNAINDFKIEYPVMQDNDYQTWRAYENRYWPAKYLLDKDGVVRYTHFGEGEYNKTEEMIQTLLRETGNSPTESIDNSEYEVNAQTPELYIGYERARFFASPEEVVPNSAQVYSFPASLPLHHFAFEGEWTVSGEYAQAHPGAKLKLNFDAQNVYLVMRSTQGVGIPVKVTASNKPSSDILVDQNKLYTLLEGESQSKKELLLEFPEGGVQIFAFTFG